MTHVDPPLPTSEPANDADPGVPFFRTWRAVYVFVIICFIAVVISLALFSRVFA